jgi:hypothetical protein
MMRHLMAIALLLVSLPAAAAPTMTVTPSTVAPGGRSKYLSEELEGLPLIGFGFLTLPHPGSILRGAKPGQELLRQFPRLT